MSLRFLFHVMITICPLRFPNNDVRFVFNFGSLWEGSCLIYVICVCLCVVVSNTCCVVFFCNGFVCLYLVSCVPNVASFSGLSILDCPFSFLKRIFIEERMTLL